MALIRTTDYKKLGDDQTVKIKKWSAVKWITLTREIAELLKTLPPDVNLSQISANDVSKILPLIPTIGEKAFNSIVRLVRESLDPVPDSNDEILSWDLEDVIGALVVVLKQNLTGELRKNLSGLGACVGLVGKSAGIANAKPIPTSEVIS